MRLVGFVAAFVLVYLAHASPGAAQPVEPAACRAALFRSIAVHVADQVRCLFVASSAVESCREVASAVLLDRLVTADTRLGCSLAAEHSALSDIVSDVVNVELPGLIGPPNPSLRCSELRWRAVARFSRQLLRARAADAVHPNEEKLTSVLARLEARLATKLARALGAGLCFPAANPPVAAVASSVAHLAESLSPTCGNDLRAASEACDGTDDDACPAACLPDCTCPTTFCGNHVVEAAEECDGTDVSACDTGLGFPQCGAPGESDACTCKYLPLAGSDVCPFPSPCPAPQSCATVAFLPPPPTFFHTCIPPEPASCSGADQCAMPSAACENGECCETIGGVCDAAHPCCGDLSCQGRCCKEALMPCVRDLDCCNGFCRPDAGGGSFCAFF